jgi:hypothetical protein
LRNGWRGICRAPTPRKPWLSFASLLDRNTADRLLVANLRRTGGRNLECQKFFQINHHAAFQKNIVFAEFKLGQAMARAKRRIWPALPSLVGLNSAAWRLLSTNFCRPGSRHLECQKFRQINHQTAFQKITAFRATPPTLTNVALKLRACQSV